MSGKKINVDDKKIKKSTFYKNKRIYGTELNTLTFKLLTTSGTQIPAYGSLILLELPLHLFILILKG